MHLNTFPGVYPTNESIVRSSIVNILLVSYVLHHILRPMQFLRISIGNFESKLVLHGHDNLHMVERVQAQVIYEMRISR